VATPQQLEQARAAGLEELDRAEEEIRGAMPQMERLTESERTARSLTTRLDFARNHHLNTKGQPLDFSDPWLLPIYRDQSPLKVLRKCVQVGISEYLIVYTLADAAAGRTVFYVLPTYSVRNRFVATRVDRPLVMVPRYRQLMFEAVGDSDSRMLKHLSRGAAYFVGSNTPNEFIEIAAETAIVDELDRCDQENIVMVPDRLQAAGAPVTILSGNPTHTEFGISDAYEKSDQREWRIKCPSCNAWQRMDFFANVLRVERDDKGEIRSSELIDSAWRETAERDVRCYCNRCGSVIDRLEADPKRSCWIAAQPGRDTTGWTISRLMSARTTVRSLYAAWLDADGDPTKMARFINNLLGEPYSPPGSALTDEILNACRRDYAMPQSSTSPCTMGIDVGKLWDVRISDSPEPGVRRALFIGRLNGPEPCRELMRRYNVKCCVIDARPETRLAIQFQKELPRGVVWRAEFPSQETVKEVVKDAREGIVKMDRTAIMDAATADILQRANWLPKDAASLLKGEYYRQMKVPKRILLESESGQRYVWTKGTDHQRLADVYDKLASVIGGSALRVVSGSLTATVPAPEN